MKRSMSVEMRADSVDARSIASPGTPQQTIVRSMDRNADDPPDPERDGIAINWKGYYLA